jgi:hypothetical protein
MNGVVELMVWLLSVSLTSIPDIAAAKCSHVFKGFLGGTARRLTQSRLARYTTNLENIQKVVVHRIEAM